MNDPTDHGFGELDPVSRQQHPQLRFARPGIRLPLAMDRLLLDGRPLPSMGSMRTALQTIIHDRAHASGIVLPIVPRSFEKSDLIGRCCLSILSAKRRT
jgi:hypothetical protein